MLPENSSESSNPHQLLAGGAGAGLVSAGLPGAAGSTEAAAAAMLQYSFCSSSSNNNYYAPLFDVSSSGKLSDGDSISPEDRTLVALRNHKEAEKRRRARINSHLDKLRSLLPCNSKTDKASLLAMVVQRVKELKQQASDISATEMLPSETDEIAVLSCDYSIDGKLIFKASMCCEDRSDLLPDLIEILKSLNLKMLRAEMATLGGRVRNILMVTADKDQSVESVHLLQNALKSLLERSDSGERSKRRRVIDRRINI